MSSTDHFWTLSAVGKEADLDIFGVVGEIDDDRDTPVDNSAAALIKELRGVGRGVARLNVNIHSIGGSVWDGLAIYRAISDFPGNKVAHVPALAASIASVIMLAADHVEVAPEATVMIHNPLMGVIGGEQDMADAIVRLKAAKEKILNIYERRTGQDREHLAALMAAETWFSGGEEIKAAGFADTVKKDLPKRRVAAVDTKLAAMWRNAPQNIFDRKPQPVSPEVQARLKNLGLES